MDEKLKKHLEDDLGLTIMERPFLWILMTCSIAAIAVASAALTIVLTR